MSRTGKILPPTKDTKYASTVHEKAKLLNVPDLLPAEELFFNSSK